MTARRLPPPSRSPVAAPGHHWTRSDASGVPSRSPIPPMRRSPLPASNSANLTEELPELNTSTKRPELPAVAWPGLTADQSWSMLALPTLRYARWALVGWALVGRALVGRALVGRARLLVGRRT